MFRSTLNAFFLFLIIGACRLVSPLAAEESSVELIPFPDTAVEKKMFSQNGTVTRLEGDRLQLTLRPKEKGSWIGFGRSRFGYPQDWSGYAFLALKMTNPNPVRQDFVVILKAGEDRKYGAVRLEPNQTARVLVATGGGSEIVGLKGQPPHPMIRPADEVADMSGWNFDPTKVESFAISSRDKEVTVVLERAELTGNASVKPEKFVDRFGQFTGADWPGKVHEVSEFAARREDERKDREQHPRMPGLSKWGGWADGPRLEATGHFRTAKHEGKWWLVDPGGQLFWSSGIDCVRLASRPSQVGGRKQLFSWLPEKDDPLARFFSDKGRLYDFFQANLCRKYGEDFAEVYYHTVAARLQSWGVNTLGNWSDYPEMARLEKLAYTVALRYQAERFVARDFIKAGKSKKKWFPDPFHPGFVPSLTAGMNEQLGECRGDPWLLGVFIDNELDWGHGSARISATVLGNPAEMPVKQAVLAHLRERFEGIEALNRELGTGFAGWSDLEKPIELTPEQRKRGEKIFADLDSRIAGKYFAGCREAMDQALPGVLYLGPRFHGNCSEEVMRVAARYCDVVSFNIYEELPGDRNADELARELDFPVIIGEWHFGATDRGMFHPGLRPALDQEDRASKYAAYLRAAVAAGWCVGAHWFQYIDQPLTGRFDGENYAIGFIDVSDDPYPEMITAAREVHAGMYPLRAGREKQQNLPKP